MADCISCGTCSPWWRPVCGEEVCNWFEVDDTGRHKQCGTSRAEASEANRGRILTSAEWAPWRETAHGRAWVLQQQAVKR